MDKRAAADFLDGILREQKIEKYSYFLNQSEMVPVTFSMIVLIPNAICFLL